MCIKPKCSFSTDMIKLFLYVRSQRNTFLSLIQPLCNRVCLRGNLILLTTRDCLPATTSSLTTHYKNQQENFMKFYSAVLDLILRGTAVEKIRGLLSAAIADVAVN